MQNNLALPRTIFNTRIQVTKDISLCHALDTVPLITYEHQHQVLGYAHKKFVHKESSIVYNLDSILSDTTDLRQTMTILIQSVAQCVTFVILTFMSLIDHELVPSKKSPGPDELCLASWHHDDRPSVLQSFHKGGPRNLRLISVVKFGCLTYMTLDSLLCIVLRAPIFLLCWAGSAADLTM